MNILVGENSLMKKIFDIIMGDLSTKIKDCDHEKSICLKN